MTCVKRILQLQCYIGTIRMKLLAYLHDEKNVARFLRKNWWLLDFFCPVFIVRETGTCGSGRSLLVHSFSVRSSERRQIKQNPFQALSIFFYMRRHNFIFYRIHTPNALKDQIFSYVMNVFGCFWDYYQFAFCNYYTTYKNVLYLPLPDWFDYRNLKTIF